MADDIRIVRAAIIKAMHDLVENATDVYWITPYETVFDRLAAIYADSGGDLDVLRKHFPEYFG